MTPADIFKGVNARAEFNALRMAYDYSYEWIGGDTIGIVGTLVADVKTQALIGDNIQFGDLMVTLVDYCREYDFWYARRAAQ